ncbi:MAG: VanZ family protein [Bacilli bacterium]|nr:VanZ family protein [Bacilli bacterium]
MKNKVLLYLSILFILIWMVIIYSFSDASSDNSNNASKGIVRSIIVFIYKDKSDKEVEKLVTKYNKPLRKLAHASVYFVLANFVNSVVCVFKKNKLLLCNIISIIICFIYACTDEWHQTFVMDRSGEFGDVLIDTFGAIIGCLVFNVIYKRIMKRRESL